MRISRISFVLASFVFVALGACSSEDGATGLDDTCKGEGCKDEGRGAGAGASGGSASGGSATGGGTAGEAGGASGGASGGAMGGTAGSASTGGASNSTGGGATGFPAPADGNPFAGATMYVNPSYAKSVQSSIDKAPDQATTLQKMKGYSTALWLDRIARVPTVKPALDDALAQQKSSGKPVVTTFVVYDLPDRDCAANASAGELASANGGMARYKKEYIDAIAAEFKAHPNQRIVAIVEPDSLPNLVTNLGVPKCKAADPVYREAVAYAISQLSMPHVYLYIDAAHSGWLGWDQNRKDAAAIFKQVLDAAGGPSKIRGFATNVSNYTPLSAAGAPHPDAYYESNPCRDEMTFVSKLGEALAEAGVTNRAFLVDTSRNGVVSTRTKWGNWCNIVGAGLGERPRANPAPGVDAFYWVKTPGESDGVADPNAARYDAMCSSTDSAPGAPQAGEWFHDYFLALVKNARPAL